MTIKKSVQVLLIAFVSITLTMISGCSFFPKEPVTKFNSLTKISSVRYPEFVDDLDYKNLDAGIIQSMNYLDKIPDNREFNFGEDVFTARHLKRTLAHFLFYIQSNPSPAEMAKFIKTNFDIYKSVGREEEKDVLFTGYYVPSLQGSLTPNEEYRYPIYDKPKSIINADLSKFSSELEGTITGRLIGNTLVPYYSRVEIEEMGALEKTETPLVWVKDRVSLFFLQVQGSGIINLDDGSVINLHYKAQNGHPYRSIGRLLINTEKIPKEEMSMQAIRRYLNANPDEISAVLNHNPSYVFFEVEDNGPLGSIGVKVTPKRSIATDKRIFPPSALAFIKTQKPVIDYKGSITEWNDFSRFVLNQDTGGAIRGPGRVDLFLGSGSDAEIAAGHMNIPGSELYFLVLRPEIYYTLEE